MDQAQPGIAFHEIKLGQAQRFLRQRLGAIEILLFDDRGRQRVAHREDQAVVVRIARFAKLKRFPVQRLGRDRILLQLRQVGQRADVIAYRAHLIRGAERPPRVGQDLAVEGGRCGLVAIAVVQHRADDAQFVARDRIGGLAVDVQRPSRAVRFARGGVVALVVVCERQRRIGLCEFVPGIGRARREQRDRGGQRLALRGIAIEMIECAGRRDQQFRARARRHDAVVLQTAHAALQQQVRGHVAARELGRTHRVEQFAEVVGGHVRLVALAFGPFALARFQRARGDGGGALRFDAAQCEIHAVQVVAEEGEGGDACRERRPIAPRGAAQPVTALFAARPDRQAVQPALQILGESARGRIALRRLFGGGQRDDRVEIPAQPARESVRRKPARLRDALRGAGVAGAEFGVFPRHATRRRLRRQARQQQAQQQAQLIEIAGGGCRFAVALLRRAPCRRHRLRPRVFRAFVVEQARDAEVQQFRIAVGVHHHVARLEIAVDHQVAMGVIDRAAELDHQAHARFQRRTPGVAPAVQRFALHQFHRQPRLVARVQAAVDQLRDVRMLQPREQLPFAQETAGEPGIAAMHALDRDFAAEAAVHALGAEDFAHAALSDAFERAIRAEAQRQRFRCRRIQVRFVDLRQQPAHARGQCVVASGPQTQCAVAVRGFHLQQGAQQRQRTVVGCIVAEGRIGAHDGLVVVMVLAAAVTAAARAGRPRSRIVAQTLAQPGPRRGPVAIDGAFVQFQHARHVRHAEADEVAQLHDLRQAFVQSRQRVQRFVQFRQAGGVGNRQFHRAREVVAQHAAAMFVAGGAARAIHQHLPHHPRRGVEQMRAALQRLRAFTIDEFQQHVVDQRGRLQGVVAPMAVQFPARDGAQVGVDHRQQPFQRRAVAFAPAPQQPRGFRRVLRCVLHADVHDGRRLSLPFVPASSMRRQRQRMEDMRGPLVGRMSGFGARARKR